jgi:hypothetical protein
MHGQMSTTYKFYLESQQDRRKVEGIKLSNIALTNEKIEALTDSEDDSESDNSEVFNKNEKKSQVFSEKNEKN